MSPEERDRLARLEQKVEGMDDWLRHMDGKLDQLVAAANMGKGAGWMLFKIGGLLVLAVGAAGWVYEKVKF